MEPNANASNTAESSPNSSALAAAAAAASGVGAAEKPRLTEQEKKSNHIASEQKRRQAIREGFDEIADLVPGLKGHGRSEAMVLEGATAYVKKLLAERWRLVAEGKSRGMDVGRYEMDLETMQIAGVAAAQEEEEEDEARYGRSDGHRRER